MKHTNTSGADDRFLSSAIWPATSLVALLLLSLFSFRESAVAAENGNRVKPGEFIIDHPTLINLGFEWLIEGDDNRNGQVEVSYRKHGETQWKQALPLLSFAVFAVRHLHLPVTIVIALNEQVEVSYRKHGETQWKQALPLLRLQGERIYQNQGVFDVVSPNMFAGSILDLEPDTEYDARFVMSDPDGFLGQSVKTVTKTVTVRTRPEPKPYAGGRVFHVYPNGYKGTKIEPAFDAVMCAYNYYCGGGDTVTAGRPRVKAGDTILVHAGLYKYHPEYYTGDRSINATTPFEGTYYLTASGTPEKPIVIKGAGDGED